MPSIYFTLPFLQFFVWVIKSKTTGGQSGRIIHFCSAIFLFLYQVINFWGHNYKADVTGKLYFLHFPYGVFLAWYIWKGCLLCSEAIISLGLNILAVTVNPKRDECAANLTFFHLSESRAQIKDTLHFPSDQEHHKLNVFR